MKVFIKAVSIIVLPILFWFGIVAAGYGAQSLSQLIEIPFVIMASFIIAYFTRNKDWFNIIGVIFLFVFLLRTVMPEIPE